MGLLIPLLIGPPILVLLVLLVLPAGRPYAIGLGLIAALCAVAAYFEFRPRPPAGPDNWYADIGELPLFATIIVSAATLPAQGWRAWRKARGAPTYYPALAILTAIAAPYLAWTYVSIL